MRICSEEGRSNVRGNVGTIFGSGQKNKTIFHESFHFMGLTDRYDDYTECGAPCFYLSDKTPPHPGFENDIMGRGFELDKIHYKNWIKHAKMRSNSGQYIPKDNSPFTIPIFKTEPYFESSVKKIDTTDGKLQDKNGNWYRRIDYGK